MFVETIQTDDNFLKINEKMKENGGIFLIVYLYKIVILIK